MFEIKVQKFDEKVKSNIAFFICYAIIIIVLMFCECYLMDKKEIKNKVARLKEKAKTLALTALIGGSSLTAHAAQNNNSYESSNYNKTEVITKHLNGQFSQKSTHSSSEHVQTIDGKTVRNYQAAQQSLYDLGDGYFMTSSEAVMQKSTDGKRNVDRNNVLYLTTPDGRTYDCSFLHDKNGPDFLPVGFEKDCFVKANGEPDTELENKLIKEVKETVGVDEITPEATIKYNNIMAQKELKIAKEKGIPNDAVAKIGVYLQQNLEFLHTGQTHIASMASFSDFQTMAMSQRQGR